ncbi:MAG: orotidine-5-phosphate decarboxylase [Bacteroidota bacterium]|jgi:orotidine-5'-phosphate decarboxylase
MNRKELIQRIRERKTFLCVGLDTDVSKIPQGISPLEFNKAIIDATREHCVAYKPNLAFYEAMGIEGWELLQETVSYIGNEHFTIADAKRGDIGNTSTQYAKAFFEKLNFDSITVAPYMGRDSVEPFLQFNDKWAIVLALTSNAGAFDFQLEQGASDRLYEKVLKEVSSWGTPENTMFVVGATKAEWLKDIRAIIPDHFLLVPGVGAQGGSLEEVVKYGMNQDVGLLINASRSIQYASNSPEDYAKAAKAEAARIHEQMKIFL